MRTTAVLLLALLTACGGDQTPRPEVGVPVAGADSAPEPPPERVYTPAESAAAVARIRDRSDSVRRAARAAAGLPAVRPGRSSAPVPSAEEGYRRCLEEAALVSQPTRGRMEAACATARDRASGS